MKNGAQPAVDEINALGGVRGRRLRLRVEEDLVVKNGRLVPDDPLM